jgi:hypothetical protein
MRGSMRMDAGVDAERMRFDPAADARMKAANGHSGDPLRLNLAISAGARSRRLFSTGADVATTRARVRTTGLTRV